MYKLNLSDNSFIIADDDFLIHLHLGFIKKDITISQYMKHYKFYKYFYLIDLINNKKYKRTFSITKIDNSNFTIGSRIKYAIDIQIGDLIIGPNGEPKTVKELHSGEDDLYNININNISYTVNGGHILALVDKDTGEHLEIPVNVYMHMDNEFKSHYVMEEVINL